MTYREKKKTVSKMVETTKAQYQFVEDETSVYELDLSCKQSKITPMLPKGTEDRKTQK